MRLGQQQRESILEKGRKLYENRFYRPALELFKKLVDDEPTISILDHCAATNEKLGDLDAALQDAMAMIRLDKHAERGYLRCATVLEKMRKSERAIHVLESGLKRCNESRVLRDKHTLMTRAITLTKPVDFVGTQLLPPEIFDMVMMRLSFRDQVACLRISKSFRQALTENWHLWKDIDTSDARRPVSASALRSYVNFGGGRTERLVLYRVALQANKSLDSLLRNCRGLVELQVVTGGLMSQTLTHAVRVTEQLKSITVYDNVLLNYSAVCAILRKCRQLKKARFLSVLWDLRASPWAPGEELGALQDLELCITQLCLGPRIKEQIDDMLPLLPALEKLRLGCSPNLGRSMFVDCLRADFLSCESTLRDLCFHGVELRFEPLKEEGSAAPYRWPESIHSITIDRSNVLWPQDEIRLKVFRDLRHLENLTWLHMGTAAERLVEALIAPAKQFESLSLGLDLVHGLDLRRIFILPCMETIRSLTLCVGSYRVTDETMGIIADAMKDLEYIKVTRCNFTGSGLKRLVSSCPRLGVAVMEDCLNVNVDAVEWARAQGLKVTFVNGLH